jgi:hypothetical protein
MRRTRVPVAVIAALLVLSVALPGVAGAGGRIPVNSTDDPGQPIANRIDAVTSIVLATNARLERVVVAWPPNPCLEIGPLCDSAFEALAAYETLGSSVDAVCRARTIDGAVRATIADGDLYAADMTANGIANQMASIATVLGNADGRLGVISPEPGPPDAPARAALQSLYAAISTGGTAAGGWVSPDGILWPPNPC